MDWLSEQVSLLWGSTAVKAPEKDEDKPQKDDEIRQEHAAQEHAALQATGDLSKEQILKFFAAGKQELESKDFRRRLKDAHFLNQDLEDIITNAQKRVFEEQGIEGNHGIHFLGKVNTVYKDDNAVMTAFLSFVSLEEDAISEAELPQETYEQNQRLLALAKGHAAELVEQLKLLPAGEQQAFLANQMQVLDKMRGGVQDGRSQSSGDAMTSEEQMRFFEKSSQNR